MSVNATQIGGTHYRSSYQHWDFVSDMGLNYLLGCTTKYVTRYKLKNGVQDLRKAVHYAEKQLELMAHREANRDVFYEMTLPPQLSRYTAEVRTERVSNFLFANFPESKTDEKEALAALVFSILCLPYTEETNSDVDFECAVEDSLHAAIPKLRELITIIDDEETAAADSAYTNQG